MTQRLNAEDIKKLQEHPEEYIYVRPPVESDFLVLRDHRRVVISSSLRPILTVPSMYRRSPFIFRMGWESLRVHHLDWMKTPWMERMTGGRINITTGDALQATWGFTIS